MSSLSPPSCSCALALTLVPACRTTQQWRQRRHCCPPRDSVVVVATLVTLVLVRPITRYPTGIPAVGGYGYGYGSPGAAPVRKPVPAYWVRVFAGYGYGYSSRYPGVYPCYSLRAVNALWHWDNLEAFKVCKTTTPRSRSLKGCLCVVSYASTGGIITNPKPYHNLPSLSVAFVEQQLVRIVLSNTQRCSRLVAITHLT